MPQWAEWLIGGSEIVGLGIATVFNGGAAGVILGASFYSAVTSAVGGDLVGGIIGGITGGWEGALDGAASDFMWGAISGSVICESDNANVKPGFNEIIRKNDKLYLIKRNFFYKVVEKLEYGNMFEKKQRRIIKAKCEKIGSEYVLFDNYRYGCDAVITQQESCASKNEKTFDFKKYIHN